MAELDGQQKLQVDLLRDLFQNCQKLETWGASLFLGALGLVAKQLIEWDAVADSSRVELKPEAAALPFLMGLAAFSFLRFVNFRSHKVLEQLHILTGSGRKRPLFGALGLALALMPFLLGFFVSWYLAMGHDDWQVILRWIWCLGVVLVVVVVVVHVIMRFSEGSSQRPNANPPIQPTGSTGG